jgi:hypothetical protein
MYGMIMRRTESAWGVSAKEKRSCSGKSVAKAILRQILQELIAQPQLRIFLTSTMAAIQHTPLDLIQQIPNFPHTMYSFA